MKKIIMSAALVAAFKRNDRKAILAETLIQLGHPDEALEVNETSRVTSALINRTCIPPEAVLEEIEEVLEEVWDDPTDLTYADKDASELTVGEIKFLVATGKKKKIAIAHEAFKEQFKKKHPSYKELKKLFKGVR